MSATLNAKPQEIRMAIESTGFGFVNVGSLLGRDEDSDIKRSKPYMPFTPDAR